MRFFFIEKKYFRHYLIVWLVATLAHFAMLFWHFGLGWQASAIDAMISNFLLFFLLLALWHVIRYAKQGNGLSSVSFFNSTIASLVLWLIWYFSSIGMLGKLLIHFEAYGPILNQSLMLRGVAGFLMTMFVFMGFLVLQLLAETREAALRENDLNMLVQKTELLALKNQLNPHFIYNSLNAISSLTITSPEKAREMVIKLSDFLRLVLKQDPNQLLSLKQELETIKLYLEIEMVRFGDRLKVAFDVEETHLEVKLPALLLQPLFENAIKHGLLTGNPEGIISFSSSLHANDLVLILSNPYDHQEKRFRSEGVGIENIRNRLRVLFGNGQLLQLRATGKLFEATLTLPVHQDS